MAQTNAIRQERSGSRQPREGMITKTIERQTARIPSVGWLGMAIGAMAMSAVFELFEGKQRKDPAAFVGLWVPTFLLFGIYNKLVKLEGHDRFSKGSEESGEIGESFAH